MVFRILGPLEVLDGDRQIALGGARQRALLGMLLLHANEVVSNDRLIDELWPGEGLAGGSKALQVAVSRLRKALGTDGLIVTRPPGYELRVDPERIDLRRFEALLAGGREALAGGEAQDAAGRLSEALGLWRGEPMADLAYESFCQGEISRLEELRTAALEDRVAADMELGRHAELVGELQDLVARQPLRERLQAQLIRALYRSGRQAEALEAYQAARAALVEGLGIEPGRELQELHAAVLRQDEVLDPQQRAAPTPSETQRSTFVGRERELDQLIEGLEGALAGRGRVALIAGDPGIGKSRLAEELLAAARGGGARVLVGRCWEAGGAPAYWPWVQSLRAYVPQTDLEALRAQLGAGAGDLAQLLPELRDLFPDLPEPPALESEGARFRLFEAASSFLRSAAQDRPLVLMLDDLHAADEPSLLLLRFLARELGESRLLVVCAFRDVDPTLRDPLSSTLAELVREPATARIGLAGLGEADVAEYIELSTGVGAAPGLVKAIHAETEGNPLFVAEVVQLLHAEGHIAQGDAHLRIPPGVRAVIGQRVGRLSERCRELLVAAAVMGREFGLDALGRLSELPRDELLDVLDEAISERVITDVPGAPGRLRFGHALIRDTLYDELSSARKLRLHRAAGEALEKAYSAGLEAHLAELAHHYFTAVPDGDPGKALEYARRAGDRAASQLAYEEAVRLYGMALTLVGEDAARCDLLLALGDAQARAGDMPAAQLAFRTAADLAEELGLREQLARGALGYGGRLVWEVSRGDVHHVPLLERALAVVGDEDSALRVKLLARLAGGPLRDASFPPERRLRLSEEALEMARRIGDPGTLAYALAGYNASNHRPDFTPEQGTLATELIRLATEAGEPELVVEGLEHRATAQLELGDMQGAKADMVAMAKMADEIRQPSQDWIVLVYRALLALLEGDFAKAEGHISDEPGLGGRAQSWNAAVTYGLQLYVLRREQGRLAEVEELVRYSVETYPTYPIWRCVLAQTAAQLGDPSEADRALEALVVDMPVDEEWLVGIGLLAEAASTLGDSDRASLIYDRLRPYGDRVAVSYPEISMGSVSRNLGLLAATMERWDDAARHFEDALEMNSRIGARPWLAHAQEDYARMLSGRDDPGDQERSRELMQAAELAYGELGIPPTGLSGGTAPSSP